MKLRHAFIGAALLVGVASASFAAQGGLWNTLPTAPNANGLSGNELAPADTQLPNGVNPQTEYISATQMRAVGYYQTVPVTAFSITVPNGVQRVILTPAGTLATGTITLPASPVDGQEVCIWDTATQTALTLSANTGQTIAGSAITALTAATRYCYQFEGNTSTGGIANQWIRTQ